MAIDNSQKNVSITAIWEIIPGINQYLGVDGNFYLMGNMSGVGN